MTKLNFIEYITREMHLNNYQNIRYEIEYIPYLDKMKRLKGDTFLIKLYNIHNPKMDSIILMKITKMYKNNLYIYLNCQQKAIGDNKYYIDKYNIYQKINNYINQNKDNFIFNEVTSMQQIEEYIRINIKDSKIKKIFWRSKNIQ